MEEAIEKLDKISVGENEEEETVNDGGQENGSSSKSMEHQRDNDEREIGETDTASMSRKEQAKIIKKFHHKKKNQSKAWGNMHIEEQALLLRAFDDLNQYTNPEKSARKVVEGAIADLRPYHRPEQYASRMEYDSWTQSLRDLFHKLRAESDRRQYWIKPENIPLYYRFALRRPLMPESKVQSYLKELGFSQDFDYEVDSFGESRNFGQRTRKELLGIEGGPSHVSTTMKYIKPRGHQRGEWSEYVPDVPEEKYDTQQISELQERAQPGQKFFSDAILEQSHEKTAFAGPSEDDDSKEIISELANFVELYRSAEFELKEVIKMIKSHLEGMPTKGYLIEIELLKLDKTFVEAATTIWSDACDTTSSSSDTKSPSSSLRSSSSSSTSDEQTDQEHYTPDEAIPSIEDADNSSSSRSFLQTSQSAMVAFNDNRSPGHRPIKQLGHTATQGIDVSATTRDQVENEKPGHEDVTLKSTQILPMATLPGGQGTDADWTASQRNIGEMRALEFSDPKPNVSELTDSQRSRTPLTSRTNQSPHPHALETQYTGTPMSISSSPPQDSSHGAWDGTVICKGRQRSPELGQTDDLFGLPMLSKKARGLGTRLGLPIEWTKTNIRTGSIQRKARKLNVAKNTASLPKINRRRRSISAALSLTNLGRVASAVYNSTTTRISTRSAKRKASTTMDSGIAPKSPRLEDHSDIFAVEGETVEDFVKSHYEPDGPCPQCGLFRCKCEDAWESQSDSEPLCSQCHQRLRSCRCPSRSLPDVPVHDPSTEQSSEIQERPPKQNAAPNSVETSTAFISFLRQVLEDDNVTASLRRMWQDPLSGSTYEKMKTILKYMLRADVVTTEEEVEALNIIDRIAMAIEKVDSKKADSVFAESVKSDVIIPYLSRVLKNDNVLALLERYGQDPLSDETFEGVRHILDHVDKFQSSGEFGFINGEQDLVAMGMLRFIVDSSERLTAYNRPFRAEKKTGCLERADNSSTEYKIPLLVFISSITETDNFLHKLRQMEKVASKIVYHESITLVTDVRDQCLQGLQAGTIYIDCSVDDKEAWRIITKLSNMVDEASRGRQNWDDHQPMGTPKPAKGPSQGSAEQAASKPNPMVAHFSCVYPQESLMKVLKGLERAPMSKDRMNQFQTILEVKKDGLTAGNFSETPRPQDRKDAKALAMITRLRAMYRPLSAWDKTHAASSERREAGDNSGSEPERKALESETTPRGLGILNSGHSPAVDPIPQAGFSAAISPQGDNSSSQESPMFLIPSDVPLQPAGNKYSMGSQSDWSTGVTPLMEQCNFVDSPRRVRFEESTPATSFGTPDITLKQTPHDSPIPDVSTDLDGLDNSEARLSPRDDAPDSSRSYASLVQGAMESSSQGFSIEPGLVDSSGSPLSPKRKVRLSLKPPKSEDLDISEMLVFPIQGAQGFSDSKLKDPPRSPEPESVTRSESVTATEKEIIGKPATRLSTKLDLRGLWPLFTQCDAKFEKSVSSSSFPNSGLQEPSESKANDSIELQINRMFGPLASPKFRFKDFFEPPSWPKANHMERTNASSVPTPGSSGMPRRSFDPKVKSIETTSRVTSSTPGLRHSPKLPPSPKVEVTDLTSPLSSPRSGFEDLPVWPPSPGPAHQSPPKPPPSPRPAPKDLPKPPPTPRLGPQSPPKPPPSPRLAPQDLRKPPPSPRLGRQDLYKPPQSRRPGPQELPKPPPSPRPGHSDLHKPLPPPGPESELSSAGSTTPEWPQDSGEPERCPTWPRDLPPRAHETWAKMSPRAALAFAEGEALRQRKSFSVYMEERRAVRMRIKKENHEANAQWHGNRFFQNSNASSGAASSNAISKLFDKYRGLFLLSCNTVLLDVLNKHRQRARRTRQNWCRRLDAIS